MTHASRHTSPKRLFAEGEYMGHYFAHPNDPRTPDDGRQDCPVCDAKGWRWVLNDDNTRVRADCEACEGARYLDESGYPVKESHE